MIPAVIGSLRKRRRAKSSRIRITDYNDYILYRERERENVVVVAVVWFLNKTPGDEGAH